MPSYKTVAFTLLELKALWIIADIGYSMPCPELERDELLESAAESALDKVYRAEKGMPRRGANLNPKRGAEIDLTRKHRETDCACSKCAEKGAA